ncbi:MAG: hypothetical protein JWQ71_1695 [Pedosphaera sp.]|nr:hypothetical protein [Pedosphaera sp.]
MKKGHWCLLIGLLPFIAGCECARDYSLTGKLWENPQLINHRGPARDPHLKVFAGLDGKDVLVQYDEEQEKNTAIKRRAFFLLANRERVWAGKQPRFVSPQTADKLQAIPLYQGTNVIRTNAALQVAFLPEARQLRVITSEGELGTFGLPVYVDWHSTRNRVLLTPLAVTGDAIIVGSIVGIIGAYCMASSYAHGNCH